MRKITLSVIMLLGAFYTSAQVGVGTTSPNAETILDAQSTEKGILIPRLTSAQRDENLEDNDPATTVTNTVLQVGTLIFNTTTGGFQFWNGTTWDQLFVAQNSQAGNDGAVVIESGNGVDPEFSVANSNQIVNSGGGDFGPQQTLIYQLPLVYSSAPATAWPENLPGGGGAIAPTTPTGAPDIYVFRPQGANPPIGNTFIENPICGQVHIWTISATFTAPNASAGVIEAEMSDPNYGVIHAHVTQPLDGRTTGQLTFVFYTIACKNTIPPDINPNGSAASEPNANGYQIKFSATKDLTTLTITRIVRVSLFKD